MFGLEVGILQTWALTNGGKPQLTALAFLANVRAVWREVAGLCWVSGIIETRRSIDGRISDSSSRRA